MNKLLAKVCKNAVDIKINKNDLLRLTFPFVHILNKSSAKKIRKRKIDILKINIIKLEKNKYFVKVLIELSLASKKEYSG